ncbi:hydroxyacid dehydrogenase [Candidatus Parvarchaeota archaeon]|uniref:Hydroxyacid dehydrogenase n=1 Tax=Candidatus Acidifodinimicrobium mancum TaxID=2898728 RepID=A0A8T3V0U2_9ARCH|nr:hydroxyacid dehydrogenase [Candidatus Acidifodinimicrobium mancum]
MKAVFFDVSELENNRINEFSEENNGIDITAYKSDITSAKDEDYGAEVISIFINSQLRKETLDKFTNLKLVLTRSTGFDHIDIDECKRRGIKLCNVPDYGDNTVAEFTFFLILSLLRGINLTRSVSANTAPGDELEGKIIGIVGVGRIGTKVAKIANAFGMKILYNSHKNNQLVDSIGGSKVELKELLNSSNVVTLHVPLTKDTYHLINKDNIKYMKKGSYLVNTSRGAVVETEAIIEGIESKTLAGAALDVIEGEEFAGKEMEIIRKGENYDLIKLALEDSILKKYDNVILTPHIAYNTHEALERIIDETLENLSNMLKGKELRNVVV